MTCGNEMEERRSAEATESSEAETEAEAEAGTQPFSASQSQSQSQNQSQYALDERGHWGYLVPLAPSRGRLASIEGNVALFGERFKIGRSQECEFSLDADNTHEKYLSGVSKVHFVVRRNLSEPRSPVIVEDLSANGTFLNGDKIGYENCRIVETNDVISLFHPALKTFMFTDLSKNEQGDFPEHISKKYFVSKTLGAGACGTVKLIYDKYTCKKYAMKVIFKKQLKNGKKHPLNNHEKIMNEVEILGSLKHPFIIDTREVYHSPNAVYIVMEAMEGGELFDFVMERGRLTERCTKIIFRQMVLAINYLHEQGITHRDLKPENVLLKIKNEEPLIKLTDFGLSKLMNESFMKTMCGTPLYVAPEVLNSNGKHYYNSQVDVWSLGVILFICLSGYLPFSEGYKNLCLRDQITKGKFFFSKPHWNNISKEAINLVKRMLNVNPNKRITVKNILSHPWMHDTEVIMTVNELIRSFDSLSVTLKRNLSDVTNNPPLKRQKISKEESGTSTE